MIVEDRTLLIPRETVRQQLSVHIFALTVLFIIANNFPCVCVCVCMGVVICIGICRDVYANVHE